MMSLEQAEQVADILADEGYEVEVRAEYSGRGMFGRSVPALVVEQGVSPVIIGWAFGHLGFHHKDAPERTDSMGLGMVIY